MGRNVKLRVRKAGGEEDEASASSQLTQQDSSRPEREEQAENDSEGPGRSSRIRVKALRGAKQGSEDVTMQDPEQDEEQPETQQAGTSSRRPRRQSRKVEEEDEADFESEDKDHEPAGRPRRRAARTSLNALTAAQREWESGLLDNDDFENDPDEAGVASTSTPRRRPSRRAAASPRKSAQKRATTDETGDEAPPTSPRPRSKRRANPEPEPESEAQAEGEDESETEAEAEADEAPAKSNAVETYEVHGETFEVKDEQLVLPSDPAGDLKVDSKGRLQGGREYRCHTFTLQYREDPERVYALTIDVARGGGYRDSLYFLRRNPKMMKLELDPHEKDVLIEQGRIASHLKTRAVTCVTMLNVFKTHGAKIIKNGRHVIDDYYEQAAREAGKKEGDLADSRSHEEVVAERAVRERDRDRERHRKRADANNYTTSNPATGESITTTFGDAGEAPFVRVENSTMRTGQLTRDDLSDENWMMRYAESVRGMNSELRETRRSRLVAFQKPKEGFESSGDEGEEDDDDDDDEYDEDEEDADSFDMDPADLLPNGKRKVHRLSRKERMLMRRPPIGLYEPHTHLPHFSLDTQPTWSTMEQLHRRPQIGQRDDATNPVLGGSRVGSAAWGVFTLETQMRIM